MTIFLKIIHRILVTHDISGFTDNCYHIHQTPLNHIQRLGITDIKFCSYTLNNA